MDKMSKKTVLQYTFEIIPARETVVDFGAGNGDWLRAATELGVKNVQGYDLVRTGIDSKIPADIREYVTIKEQPAYLQNIAIADLNKPVLCDIKYDLAIAVEVAEHLHPDSSETFVETLTNASDFVLFSAAIPYQWGIGHINIRWHTFWADLFVKRGFKAADCLRHLLWDSEEDELMCGYKQNIMLFAKAERYKELKLPEWDYSQVRNLVHPYLYTNIHGESYSHADRNRKY